MGNAGLSPIGILTPQFDHLGFDLRRLRVQCMRHSALEFFQTRVTVFLKAWLPVIKEPLAYPRFPTRLINVPCGFPGLKKQFPLLGGSKTVVGAFWAHVLMLPHFGVSVRCS